MRIVIVGAGAVGSYLAERLSSEGQDVVVIEDNERLAAQLQESLDAMVIHGNGASAHVLEEALAAKSDLLIAVSDSDGANVLACYTATELGTKTTIARIEDPEISEGADRLGVDMVIDPSATAAAELVGIVGLGGATELIPFAGGKLVMVGGIVAPNAPLTEAPLDYIRMRTAEWSWVVAALVREGRTIVAHGDTVVQPGDHALLMTTDDRVDDATRLLALKRRHLERVLILGGTRLAELTAEAMSDAGLSVVVVDPDDERCRYLAARHPRSLVVHGDPTDPGIMRDLDLGPKDVAIALSGWDEVNVLACLVAKATGAGMVISRFNRIAYVGLLSGVGIDAAVSSRLLAASAILRYVRGGRVEQVAAFSDTDAEAIELEVEEGSEACDKTLLELKLPAGVVVGGISRDGTTFVPDGSTMVRPGDHVIVFSLPKDMEKTSALFTA